MIGLDTNVLVRYLAQDDDVQSAIATRLIDSLDSTNPGFVSLVTLVETVWVLSRAYGLGRPALESIVEGLLRSSELLLDRRDEVLGALSLHRAGGAEFSDCLIATISARAGCERTMTFDVRAARTAGMTLLLD